MIFITQICNFLKLTFWQSQSLFPQKLARCLLKRKQTEILTFFPSSLADFLSLYCIKQRTTSFLDIYLVESYDCEYSSSLLLPVFNDFFLSFFKKYSFSLLCNKYNESWVCLSQIWKPETWLLKVYICVFLDNSVKYFLFSHSIHDFYVIMKLTCLIPLLKLHLKRFGILW